MSEREPTEHELELAEKVADEQTHSLYGLQVIRLRDAIARALATYGDEREAKTWGKAAERIRHRVHAAGCDFHRYARNDGKVCPTQEHEIYCYHCERKAAALRAAAKDGTK